MTLTTHAVTGALVGAVASSNPAFAAVAAFASHFLLDAIPHWDYSLSTVSEDSKNPLNNNMQTKGKRFYVDLSKTLFDAVLGMAIVILVFMNAPVQVLIGALIGAIFAVAPDPLQFVYWKLRLRILEPVQKFHLFIHAKTLLKDRPVIGIGSQIILIILTVLAAHALWY
ncbi:MAG: hypothetical protein V4519_01395 [Patescibacteria group bacterium]